MIVIAMPVDTGGGTRCGIAPAASLWPRGAAAKPVEADGDDRPTLPVPRHPPSRRSSPVS